MYICIKVYITATEPQILVSPSLSWFEHRQFLYFNIQDRPCVYIWYQPGSALHDNRPTAGVDCYDASIFTNMYLVMDLGCLCKNFLDTVCQLGDLIVRRCMPPDTDKSRGNGFTLTSATLSLMLRICYRWLLNAWVFLEVFTLMAGMDCRSPWQEWHIDICRWLSCSKDMSRISLDMTRKHQHIYGVSFVLLQDVTGSTSCHDPQHIV